MTVDITIIVGVAIRGEESSAVILVSPLIRPFGFWPLSVSSFTYE
jgi:hypothetical protein